MSARLLLAGWVSIACGCGWSVDPCDIRQTACQDEVFYATLEARGDTWDAWAEPPASRVISTETFRQLLEADVDPGDGYDLWDEAFTLVGMVDPDADRIAASIESRLANTVAFYSPVDRSVTIIDHGEPTEMNRDVETLAHEYVHSLQDRYHGLFAIEGTAASWDEWFAARSVVEGEAVLISSRIYLSTLGRDFESVDWDATFDHWRTSTGVDVAASPSRFGEALRMVYPLGTQYVVDAYRDGGPLEVQRWLYHPPRTALHLLSGPDGVRAPFGAIACPSRAPGGYELEGEDVLGPIGVYALLNDDEVWWARSAEDFAVVIFANGPSGVRQLADPDRWWPQSRAWRGDAFRAFRAGDATAVSWRLRWSSAARARAFLATLEGRPLGWRLFQLDDEVVIAAATDEVLLDTWDPLACE